MPLFGRETEQGRARAEAYAQWLQSQNPCAIASFVLGVFSLIEFGALIIFGVAGIVLGAIGLHQLNRIHRKSDTSSNGSETSFETAPAGSVDYARGRLPEPIHAINYEPREWKVPRNRGRWLAWSGIITSVLSLAIAALLYFRVFG